MYCKWYFILLNTILVQILFQKKIAPLGFFEIRIKANVACQRSSWVRFQRGFSISFSKELTVFKTIFINKLSIFSRDYVTRIDLESDIDLVFTQGLVMIQKFSKASLFHVLFHINIVMIRYVDLELAIDLVFT
jgi:hypothetical protein